MKLHKALFLDRDGVVNVDHGYVYQSEKFEFIKGIFSTCKKFYDAGYKIIVVTNQSGIGRGYYTEADFGFGDSDSDQTLVNSVWNELGSSLQVPAQQEIAWGIGKRSDGGVDTRRNITFRVDHTDGNQIMGVVRLAIANANKTDIRIVLEDRTENLDDGVPLEESALRAKEDSYLMHSRKEICQ